MLVRFVLFFFKQKTAYEMRISDWSSDVCSSDLPSPAVCVRSLVQMLASSVISFMRRTPLQRWLCRPQDADLVRIGRIVRARLLVQFYGHRRVSQRQL